MKILGIPFAIFMVLGIFASVAQTGFVYAPKKLEPNWNKLNIFAAMTQFINMKKIVESLKASSKLPSSHLSAFSSSALIWKRST